MIMLKQKLLIIIAGITLGLISFFLKGTTFILLLCVVVGYLIYSFSRLQENKFLLFMFVIGVLLRVAAVFLQDGAALIFFPGASMHKVENPQPKDDDYSNLIMEKTRIFFKIGDSDYASARGYIYAAYARGDDNIVIRHYLSDAGKEYGWHGYLYVIGLFYYLFDYSPIAVKFINCILGALTATFIYLLCLNFSRSGAKTAHFLVSFFPTLILWSTTHLKDMSVLFLAVVTVWAMVNFLTIKSPRYFIWLVASVFLQFFLTKRDLWLLSLAFIGLTGLIFIIMKSKRRNLWIIAFICLGLLLIIFYRHELDAFVRQKIYKLLIVHVGHVGTGGATYRVLDHAYYANADLLNRISYFSMLKVSLKSMYYFMLEPLLGRFSDSAFLCLFPQVVLWYFLLPFMFIGVLISLSKNFIAALTVLIYSLLSSMAIALSSGNVGTLLRHRDYVSAFFLMLAAIGLSIFSNKAPSMEEKRT